MARRAASIWRAVRRPRLVAFRPHSPKATVAPRVARPTLLPFCSLRYFLLLGCSILRSCLSHTLHCGRSGVGFRFRLHVAVRTLGANGPALRLVITTFGTRATTRTLGGVVGFLVDDANLFAGNLVTLVDPNLDA